MNALLRIALLLSFLGVAACGPQPSGNPAATPSARTDTPTASQSHAALPTVVAYRSPTCSCCELWIEHMRAAGFAVEVVTTRNVQKVKSEAGIPAGQSSCHTAKVGDYYVEGHVPSADIKRMLAERPQARGLVVPGMVPGSPGMEQSGASRPYDVLLVANDGSTTVYSHHGD